MLGMPVKAESVRVEDVPWKKIQTESYVDDSTYHTTKTPFFSYEKNKTAENKQNNDNSNSHAMYCERLRQIPRDLERRYFNDVDDTDENGYAVLP